MAKSVFNSYACLVVAILEHNTTVHSNYITGSTTGHMLAR